jgi:pSer/pThr/pTyr-binding forkhead associated (FHA) protein
MPSRVNLPKLKRLRDDRLLVINDAAIAGRHSSCDISLAHEQGASRKHARFNVRSHEITISDLGSLNGTLVNGTEIDGTHTLQDGDIIAFDTDKYLLLFPQQRHSASAQSNASTADTVIADKNERADPSSIKPAIKIITDKPLPQPTEQAHNNTMEYLNSLPDPDMKRPVGMPETRTPSATRKIWTISVLAAMFLAIVLYAVYHLGARSVL